MNIIQNTTLAGVIGGLDLLEAGKRQNERLAAFPPIGIGEIHAFEIFMRRRGRSSSASRSRSRGSPRTSRSASSCERSAAGRPRARPPGVGVASSGWRARCRSQSERRATLACDAATCLPQRCRRSSSTLVETATGVVLLVLVVGDALADLAGLVREVVARRIGSPNLSTVSMNVRMSCSAADWSDPAGTHPRADSIWLTESSWYGAPVAPTATTSRPLVFCGALPALVAAAAARKAKQAQVAKRRERIGMANPRTLGPGRAPAEPGSGLESRHSRTRWEGVP